MNAFLLNRQQGSISHDAFAKAQNERLLRALQYDPATRFAFNPAASAALVGQGHVNAHMSDVAHVAGVNSIAVDRFEGRYLISGGGDSSLAVWDLEGSQESTQGPDIIAPLAVSNRTSTKESLGITHLTFYPYDSLACLTSGYDHTLKLHSTETLTTSASFNLNSTVYSHATSTVPGAAHLLVACASQHPAVRLVDLRSGAATHSLSGHAGSVLTVAWHPRTSHILASGGSDGAVRLWDIRRSASSLGVLDQDDSIDIPGHDGRGTGARRRERGRAHTGAVNGIAWTADGTYLVSAAHDERMRVWDMRSGANTLVNFGPSLTNAHTGVLLPLLAPSHLTSAAPPGGSETLFYPNPKEILAFDLHSGSLQSRLRVTSLPPLPMPTESPPPIYPSSSSSSLPPRPSTASASAAVAQGSRNAKPRTTSLAWRAHHIELLSAHNDGAIRRWRPRTWEDTLAEEEADDFRTGVAGSERARKRKRDREVFDDILNGLQGRKITFG